MQMSALRGVKLISFIVCLLLVFTGLAYLWHYIPEGQFTGVQPPDHYNIENAWKVYNELTGWCLIFSGITTLTFVIILRKFNKSILKYVLLVWSSLLLSLFLAAILASLFEMFML